MATIKVDSQSTPGIFKIKIDQDLPLKCSITATSVELEITDTIAGILSALINEAFADRRAHGKPALTAQAERELAWSVLGKPQNREASA
jgi:hypothetical protein